MALWLVRAGRAGEQETNCLTENFVTIGWTDLPDLSSFSTKEELKKIYSEMYPNEKSGAVNNRVGQIWSFSKNILPGNIVALPLKSSPFIAFGEVTSEYKYTKKYGDGIRHILPVKWLNKEVPRQSFDQNLLYSLGAFMTVCQIQRDGAEEKVKNVLFGKKLSINKQVIDLDEDKAAFDLAEISRNQIVDYLNNNFKGHKLEELIEAILQAQGYTTDRAAKGNDGGADILAGKGEMGFGSPRLLVEVKTEDTPIGINVVDRVRGALDKFNADYGLIISLNGFKVGLKKQCREAFFKIRLWDQNDLINELINVYDKLPESIQVEIPLQQTWSLALKD
jgi:restriction system protein